MANRIFQTEATIIKNTKVTGEYYKIVLSSMNIAKNAQPGQFVNIKVSDNFEPLLRRPFSIHRINGSRIEFLYEVIGKGTEILSQKIAGEYLDIIGPLGNGFNLTPKTYNLTPILVAGGIGVAPLLFLAERLSNTKHQIPNTKIVVLIGAKIKSHILCEKEFKQLGCEVKVATDDGSRGSKGKVTDLLRNLVSSIKYQVSSIYACGPRPMLKEITNISKKYNIPAQISLEEHMACGIGTCLGCVVNTIEGYKRVCKDGPVFRADEII